MNTFYTFENGHKIRPSFAFCDSGGHRTNAVFIYSYRNKRFMPIKGFVSNAKNAVDPLLGRQVKMAMSSGIKGKCLVQFLGVNAAKDTLAQLEILTIAGDKHLYYPKKCGYDDQYFRGLLSEKKVGGKWIAPLKGHTSNELLDCRVYAMACAEYYLHKYYLTGKDAEMMEMSMARKKQNKEKEEVKQVESNSKQDEVVSEIPKQDEVVSDIPKEEKPVPVERKRNFPHL